MQRFSHRRFEKIWNGKALLAEAKAERARKQEERAPLIAAKLAARLLQRETEAATKAAEVRKAERAQERKNSAAGRTPLREKLAALTEFMTVTDPYNPAQSVAIELNDGSQLAMTLAAPTSFPGFQLGRTSRAGDRRNGLAVSHYHVIPPEPAGELDTKSLAAWAEQARSVAKPALQMLLLHPNKQDGVNFNVQSDSGLIRDLIPFRIQSESQTGSQPTSTTPSIVTRDFIAWAKSALGSAYREIAEQHDILPDNPIEAKHRFDFSRLEGATAKLSEVYGWNLGPYRQTPEEAAILSHPASVPSKDSRLKHLQSQA